jgi:hypothetical protein
MPLAPAAPIAARTPLAAATAPTSDVEAMVAAAPSRDNPFLTQRNRRRRAHFLLAQRQALRTADPVARAAPVATPASAAATDRSQTVYRFGSDRARPGLFKPRTS